jgi:CheY-like chemotaxis protein
MLAADDRLVIMVLGIFLAVLEGPPSSISGSPLYMAPETVSNRLVPGAWHLVDLYSVGVIAYELLTGHAPFEDGGGVLDILARRFQEDAPPVSRYRRGVPPELELLIAELLARDPAERPPTADAALWRLRAIRKLQKSPTRPFSVLIVDDDPDAVALMRGCVRRAVDGADVRAAADGERALAELQREPPDLMLLDLSLPGMNGLELCMYLRGTKLLRCPIVSVSAAIREADQPILRELGVTDFIEKGPAMLDHLRDVVRSFRA